MRNLILALVCIASVVACESDLKTNNEDNQRILERYHNREDSLFKATLAKLGVADDSKIDTSLYVVVKSEGGGESVKSGDRIYARYKGYLIHDSLVRADTLRHELVFDTNIGNGKSEFTFNLGESAVIKAWDKAIEGKKKGSKLTIFTKSNYAYGWRGVAYTMIHPYAPLMFEVEILDK